MKKQYDRTKRKQKLISKHDDSDDDVEPGLRENKRPIRKSAVNAAKRLRKAQLEDRLAEKILMEADPIKQRPQASPSYSREPYIPPAPQPKSEYEKKRDENMRRNAEALHRLFD